LLSCKINSYLLVNDGEVEIGCVAVDSDVVLVYAYQKAFKKENQHQKSITNMKMVLNRLIDGPPLLCFGFGFVSELLHSI
jgi:hypothetical protein